MFIVNDQTFTGYSDIYLDLAYVLAIFFLTLVIFSKNPKVLLITVELIFMFITNITVRAPLKECIWSMDLNITLCFFLILALNILVSVFIYKLFNNLFYKFCLIVTILVILNPLVIDYGFVFMANLPNSDLRVLLNNMDQGLHKHIDEARWFRTKMHECNTIANSVDNNPIASISEKNSAHTLREAYKNFSDRREDALHNAEFFAHHTTLLSDYIYKPLSNL